MSITDAGVSVRWVVVSILIVGSIVGSVGGFAGTTSASLSTATTQDVVAGLANASQAVTVEGQATGDGATDYYQVRITDIIRAGATIQGARFLNVGQDEDTIAPNSSIQYDPVNQTITFAVTEDATDVDKKVDFQVVLQLDTTEAIASDELRYGVVQYPTAKLDNALSPQAAQFRLIGSNVLSARTSSDRSGASPVTHRAVLTMPLRERGVTHITVNTTGANYENLSHREVIIRRNGGNDLVTTLGAVTGSGGGLLIRLDTTTNFYKGDEVRIVLRQARNPAQTRVLTVTFRTSPTDPAFATSDEIKIAVECPDEGATIGGSFPASTDTSIAGVIGAILALIGRAVFGRMRG